MRSLEEKKEEVLIHYSRSYDLDIAMMKADLTEDEKKLLQHDSSFLYRISYQDARIREEIVEVMVGNLRSADDKLAQKAALDLGNLLWKEKFKNNETKPQQIVPDQIILKGEKPKVEVVDGVSK